MADSTVLKLKFDTMSGSKTWTIRDAKASTTLESIRNIESVMVENSTLFQYRPVKLTEAKMVTTTESEYNLN